VKLTENTRFIGILSRFSGRSHSGENKFKFPHNTVILSGPEPQRGILRQKLIEILKHREPPTVILEGKPGISDGTSKSENIISYNHLAADEMQDMITGSLSIFTRSGYTSIMELISMNCSALLIPTPGQTEQEFLAKHLSAKGWFNAVSQSKLSADTALPSGKALWTSEIIDESRELLEKALDELLNQ
jgi:UDP-N-acetylglucosamine:LPS N-acetylglucosamine transferase